MDHCDEIDKAAEDLNRIELLQQHGGAAPKIDEVLRLVRQAREELEAAAQ
ncbi:MAG TPA: hypothetical protein VF017_14755 [Thermoanaerobaculia bacterium]|nr:hypothetical protein [Thermoanaerobaculia bacterium]